MIVLKKFRRCVLHKHYVESRILELRNDICQDALNKGTINVEWEQQKKILEN